jgi:hypothetical protein
MSKTASVDIMCVGQKSVREKFTGMIRYALTLPALCLVDNC